MSEQKTKDNGGPAFPTLDNNGQGLVLREWGMTLRDWFAGQATEEDVRAHQEWVWDGHDGLMKPTYTREVAKYRYADAMIEARK